MKYGVARLGSNGTVFDDCSAPVLKNFCANKRGLRDSQCSSHYQSLWDEEDIGRKIEMRRCPYGLVTTNAVGGRSHPVALTSFWVKEIGDPLAPEDVINEASVADLDRNNTLLAIREITDGIRAEELEHFEAALHDTRHLNHSITQNAELVLKTLGWDADAVWDMEALQKDDLSRRALTIYAASRDLAQAILMHEISRAPEQATRDVSSQQIHKLFYRQWKISTERMAKANVTCMLGACNKTLQLSNAFRVLPKILMDNAIKYSSRGTEIQITFTESLQSFIIECRNIGPIVKEDETARVFHRGVRGSNKAGVSGQGIGLWLAKTIVEANRGRIEFLIRDTGPDYSGRMLGRTIVTIKLPI